MSGHVSFGSATTLSDAKTLQDATAGADMFASQVCTCQLTFSLLSNTVGLEADTKHDGNQYARTPSLEHRSYRFDNRTLSPEGTKQANDPFTSLCTPTSTPTSTPRPHLCQRPRRPNYSRASLVKNLALREGSYPADGQGVFVELSNGLLVGCLTR